MTVVFPDNPGNQASMRGGTPPSLHLQPENPPAIDTGGSPRTDLAKE